RQPRNRVANDTSKEFTEVRYNISKIQLRLSAVRGHPAKRITVTPWPRVMIPITGASSGLSRAYRLVQDVCLNTKLQVNRGRGWRLGIRARYLRAVCGSCVKGTGQA